MMRQEAPDDIDGPDALCRGVIVQHQPVANDVRSQRHDVLFVDARAALQQRARP